eukprot:1228627-Rhodomonas_salina.1
MPPKSKKSLSLSQKPTKAPPAKKIKVEKDVAQPSISNFFSSSGSQATKPDVGVKGNRGPLATLGASQANNLDRQPEAAQKNAITAPKQVASSSQSIFATGSKRSRDLLQLAAQSSSSSPVPKAGSGPHITPGPKICSGPSITPATLVKNRPTLFTCPGPSTPNAGLSGPSPHKLERHATFGLGTDSYEPSLSQECHDLLADDDDDYSRLEMDDSSVSASKKRCRSFPGARTAPAADPARPLARCGSALVGNGLERSKQAVPRMPGRLSSRLGCEMPAVTQRVAGPGRSVSAPVGNLVGKSQELRQIYSKLRTCVQGADTGSPQPEARPEPEGQQPALPRHRAQERAQEGAATLDDSSAPSTSMCEPEPARESEALGASGRGEEQEGKSEAAAAEGGGEAILVEEESESVEMKRVKEESASVEEARESVK